jgi:hypothetical protein
MATIKELLNYLKTLWGLLATAAVLFPGAAAFLKIPIAVEESKIAALYPIIGTTVSAFATLFLITFRKQLLDLKFAHKLSIFGMAFALVCFFSFVLVRVVYLDVDMYRVVSSDREKNIEIREYKKRGLLGEEHTELVSRVPDGGRKIFYESRRGDPLDIVALLLFTGTFASLGFAFTALGIHTYEATRKARSN